MDNDSIIVEHSLDEEHLQKVNQHGEDLPKDQTDLRSSKKEIKMAKKGPMHPTPLYVSLRISQSSSSTICISENTLGAQCIRLKH